MGTERTSRSGPVWAWVALLAALAVPTPIQAHQQEERREVVLILSPDRVQLMVGYTLPAGAQAAEARALIDADRSGAVDRPQEELARATLLVPRLLEGLSLTLDGEAIGLELEDLAWREGPGDPGPRQGFTGLALYSAPTTWAVGLPRDVVLEATEGAMPTSVEVQLEAGLELVDSTVPLDPAVPILGPMELLPSLPIRVRVRWAGPAAVGSGAP